MTAHPPVLTLDQDRLFRESAWGKAALARAEEEGRRLTEENRRIDAALENEERDLTDRRATLSAAEFAPLASAFDSKVEEIRTAQEAKSRAIGRQLEEDRQRFFEAATPVLAQLLEESGAAAILSDSAVIMSLSALDITSSAIARVDTALPPPQDDPAPPEGADPAPDAPAPDTPAP
ncbi:MAG: OmpH family outer membrane protein [Paracoccaceae bacterium]